MNGLGMYGMRYGARPEEFGAPGTEMPAFMQGQILANQQYAQQQDQQQQMQARQFALQQAEDAADNQQQFNQLASQAYDTPVDQRNTLLGKMAALNPQEAARQALVYGEMDKAKQAQHQAALTSLAQKFTAIAQDSDPQRQQQEYNALIAQAAATGKDVSMFKNVPPSVGAKMALAQIEDIKGLAGMNGMTPSDQAKVVGNALVDPRTGKVIYQAPKQEWKFDPTSGTMVDMQTGQYRVVTPASGAGQVNVGQPAPASIIDGNVPAGTQVTQATGPDGTKVAFAFAPGTPDAVKEQAAAGAGVQQPAPMTLAQYKASLKNQSDSGLSGRTPEEALSSLSPADQALVKKIASYEMKPSDLGRSKNRAEFMALAAYLNPDYNASNADAANAYLKDMAKSSPTSVGGQVQSLNQVLHHLQEMIGASPALPGSGVTPFNAAENYFNSRFRGNSPAGVAVGNWDQGKVFINQELGKLLKGGVASEAEVKALEDKMDAASSSQERRQALYNVASYVDGKITTLTDRRDKLLGNMAPKTSLLDAQSQKALREAYALKGEESPELLPPGTTYATGALAAAVAPQGVPSGPIATNPQTGQRVQWNGTAWVPAQ